MFETTRGMLVPGRQTPAAFDLRVDRRRAAWPREADDSMVDVRTLPRLEGAVEERPTDPHANPIA